jgi:hypothetical protein
MSAVLKEQSVDPNAQLAAIRTQIAAKESERPRAGRKSTPALRLDWLPTERS